MSLTEHLVRNFHVHFGLPIGDTSKTTNKLRADLVAQEAAELVEALQAYDADPTRENLAHVAHEAADVLFAVVGTNLTLGIDTDAATVAVYNSLMTREGADPDGKVRKGPDYVPPDMTPALPGVEPPSTAPIEDWVDVVASCAICWPRPCGNPPWRPYCKRLETS